MKPYESARDEVNRANALLSTGPKTEEGKQRSSLNALRHGLTGQTVVMPTEDLLATNSTSNPSPASTNPKAQQRKT